MRLLSTLAISVFPCLLHLSVCLSYLPTEALNVPVASTDIRHYLFRRYLDILFLGSASFSHLRLQREFMTRRGPTCPGSERHGSLVGTYIVHALPL